MKFVRLIAAAGALGVAASNASAQLPQTRITALFPVGAKAGESTEITIANGADLDDVNEMFFSHPGLQAKKKDGAANVFTVTIAPDVPAGIYEARVRGLFGASNPRSFVVGNLPESRETEPNNTKEQATAVSIGSVINGQSNGGPDIDVYKVTGKAGQRVLIECEALKLDSRFQASLRLLTSAGKQLGHGTATNGKDDPLLDVTLPSDGEYFLRVADLVYGSSTEYPYRLKIHTGPHIDFISPPAGVPGTTGTFTLYGRNLTGSQPSALTIGDKKLEQLQVQIALPGATDTLDVTNPRSAREAHGDGVAYTHRGPNGVSNVVPIAFAPKALITEVEPNNLAANAQKIPVPNDVAGIFQAKSDIDIFEFEAKAQQVFWVDVYAQRIGSPADPYMTIDKVNRNEKGEETLQRLAAQDDTTVNAVDAKMFDTNHDDVSYRFVAPADGSYRINVRDRYFEARGAANLQYQLAIREETPDYRLVAVMPFPQATAQRQAQGFVTGELAIRRGENLDILVAALRRHGYAGVIDITAENLPAGVTCKPASIPAGLNNCSLVFSVAEDAKPMAQPIRIVGKARVESAVAVKAVTDTETTLTVAVTKLPMLDQALQKTVQPMQQAEQARKPVEEKFNVDTANTKKAEEAKAAAEKKVVDSEATAKSSTEEKQKADKVLADAKAANNQDAINAAQQALTAADQKLAQANQTVATAKAESQAATNAFNQATQVLKQSTDAKQKTVTAHEQAVAAFQKAEADKKAGEAEIAKQQQALAQAKQAREAAVKLVAHEARASTITWSGSAQASSQSRLTQTLTLSVVDEVAPLQVLMDGGREVANHNRQILVLVKLAKRNGFDNNVVLTPQAVPQNLQVQPLTIEKGKSEGVLRLFVPNNVKEDTYTIYLEGAAQVPYLKNVGRLNRAKAEVEAAVAAVTATTEVQKKAVTDADVAMKAVTQATEAMKKAQTDLDAAKKKAVDTQAASTKADQDQATADKAAADAIAKTKLATDAAAQAKEAAAKDATNQDLAKKSQDAEQARVAAETAQKAAVDFAAAAKKVADDTKAVLKVATDGATAAQTVLTTATQEVTKTTEAKKVVDAAKTAADAALKAATDRKTAGDNEVKAADAYTKSLNNGAPQIFPPSTPIVITVKKAPFTLAAAPANGGNVKKGEKVEVKVTVTRINGFTGALKLTLPLPPGVVGIAAEPVVVPADKNEVTLVIAPAGDAPEGAIANLVIRAEADFDGPAASDQPVALTVQK